VQGGETALSVDNQRVDGDRARYAGRDDGEAAESAPVPNLEAGTRLTRLAGIGAGVLLRGRADVEVIELHDDAQWSGAERALTNAFAPNRSGTRDELRDFVVRQRARYRAMQARSLGQWYGAVIDGEIAAALGIVRERELGRFQLVGTDPKFARRGVCSTLVHDAAQLALAKRGISTFVMAADAHYRAAKVYESVGFRPTERLVALLAKPPKA